MYRIMIADDDADSLALVKPYLQQEGYALIIVSSVDDLLRRALVEQPDAIIVSTSLRDLDAIEVCRQLRLDRRLASRPLILLADRAACALAEALAAGFDDYLRKPVITRELSARLRAHLRRHVPHLPERLPTIRLVPDETAVYVNERAVALTGVEYRLLEHLCRHAEEPHSPACLLQDVWAYEAGEGDPALVRNHVRNLRLKLEDDPDRPLIIQSRHGRGYTVRARVLLGALAAILV